MRNLMMVLGLATLFVGGDARAHALLRKAVPPVGGTVHGAPTELSLRFSEAVEPHFCSVAVLDATGAREDNGAPRTAPGDGTLLLVTLKPLGAGTYTVQWHATSVDTHKTEGSYTFTVAP
jgi:methionine-rich copper-binding protein CopC